MDSNVFKIGNYMCHRKRIGKGSYSRVYKGYNIDTKEKVAIKEVDLDITEHMKKFMVREIDVLKKMSHPNIVKLLDVIENNETNTIYLILEYCKNGDFSRFQNKRPLKEKHALNYMKQLASGLQYITSNNIMHRDLKPQNMLISDTHILKLTDFGFARYFETNTMVNTLCGSPLYMAPEIMRDKKYTHKADLWSVGVIMYEMLTGKLPFKSRTHYDLILEIERLNVKIPECYSITTEGENLVKSLLIKEPEKRISWEDFFNHPWMTGKWMNEYNEMMSPLFDESDSYDDCDDINVNKSQENKSQENKSQENKSQENKSQENKSQENKSQENKSQENKSQIKSNINTKKIDTSVVKVLINESKNPNSQESSENTENSKLQHFPSSSAVNIPSKGRVIDEWCSKSTPVSASKGSPMFSNINNDEFIVLEMQDSDNFVDNQQQSTIKNIKEAISYSFYILKNSCSILKLGSYK